MRISDWSSDVCSSDLSSPTPRSFVGARLPSRQGFSLSKPDYVSQIRAGQPYHPVAQTSAKGAARHPFQCAFLRVFYFRLDHTFHRPGPPAAVNLHVPSELNTQLERKHVV